jgi:multimeric flavodoxin WrbA
LTGSPLTALILNCTLKRSPEPSNSEALARVLGDALVELGATYEVVRIADHVVHPGVKTDEGDGDEWPLIHEKLLAAEILVIATPIWMGQPSSVSKRVIERMDAMLSETDAAGRPVAFDRVAGFVVTGNEDGAHHVIAELAQGLFDLGYTVPGQAWTYWHLGPGPGPDYLEETRGHEWAHLAARNAAANLVAVAHALRARPLPVPES